MEHRISNELECPHSVTSRMSQARADLETLVWPVVRPSLGDGEIETIEGRGDAIFRRLDCGAKVDYIFESAKGVRPMFGISPRDSWAGLSSGCVTRNRCGISMSDD